MSTNTIGIRRGSVTWLTLTAFLTAMNIVLSLSISSIPVPGGHLYFCDAVINTAAILLDPLSAFIVSGVGSFLGDFFFYPAPMFVSLATHGLQAVIVSLLSHRLWRKRQVLSSGFAVTVGALIMVAGYTLGRAYVYSTVEYAIIKLPFEFLQAGFGAVFSIILLYPMQLKKTHLRIFHPKNPKKEGEGKMRAIHTDKAPAAIGPYSQAVAVNGILYTSGQIPIDPHSGIIESKGIEEQTEQVIQNLKAILEVAGSDLKHVIKTTCFLLHISDFAAFNAVYEKHFPSKPARSCVEVAALPKGALVEIEAVAIIDLY